MRFHHRLLLCSIGVATLAHPRAGWAAPPQAQETTAMTDKARQLYEEGLAAYKKGKVHEAHASYLAAWSLNKHWQIAANLADTELDLGKYREAAEHATYYQKNAPPSRKEKADALVQRALARVGSLAIEVDVAGAEVLVDDAVVGRSPLTGPVFVDPGERRVTARFAGKADAVSVVAVGAGASSKAALVVLKKEAAPPLPPSAPPPRSLVPGVVLGGVAVAGIATGIGLLVAGGGKRSAAEGVAEEILAARGSCVGGAANFDARCGEVASSTRASDRLHDAGVGVLIGGAAFATAATLYFLWPSSRVTAAPMVGTAGAGLIIRGSF